MSRKITVLLLPYIEVNMYHYTECGLRNVWLENGYIAKKTPYGDAISILDVDGLHKVIGLHLVNEKSRLSGAEVRFLRKEMNVTQKFLAETLGVSESSVRAWETHATKIPKPPERLLRLLYKSSVDKNSDVSKTLERVAHLDRKMHEGRASFSHIGDRGWSERTIQAQPL